MITMDMIGKVRRMKMRWGLDQRDLEEDGFGQEHRQEVAEGAGGDPAAV